MSCISPAVAAFLATIALIVVFHAEGTEAKRGCAAFGHSCYGGMGKRQDGSLPTKEEFLRYLLRGSQEAYPITNNEFTSSERPQMSPEQLYSISPILRRLFQSYRNFQATRSKNSM